MEEEVNLLPENKWIHQDYLDGTELHHSRSFLPRSEMSAFLSSSSNT